jgi:hypothetical protein
VRRASRPRSEILRQRRLRFVVELREAVEHVARDALLAMIGVDIAGRDALHRGLGARDVLAGANLLLDPLELGQLLVLATGEQREYDQEAH